MADEIHLAGEGGVLKVPVGSPKVVGREATVDFPIFHESISRRHARLQVVPEGLAVEDLGSTNGTFVNGDAVKEGVARPGDTVVFGGVSFRVERPAAAARPSASSLSLGKSRILRTRMVSASFLPGSEEEEEEVRPGTQFLKLMERGASETKVQKLAALVEIASALSRTESLDELMAKTVELVFRVLGPDRACLMTVEGADMELQPRVCRDRDGRAVGAGFVPTELAYQAVVERLAILSENLAADERFGGPSEVPRSALCLPLLGEAGEVIAVLYLDKRMDLEPFDEEDLDYLTALGNVAGAALENRRLRERAAARSGEVARLERAFDPNRDLASSHPMLAGLARPRLTLLACRVTGLERVKASFTALEELLGSFLDGAAGTLKDYGGSLAYSLGAEVVAVWGAATARPDDADRALRAARDLAREGAALAGRWHGGGEAPAVVVALHQGLALAGTIGAERPTFVLNGEALEAVRSLAASGDGPLVASKTFVGALSNPPGTRRARGRSLLGDGALVLD